MTKSFTNRVYDKTKMIPKGKVSTYGEIARSLHSNAYRAVGQALRHNPYAPKVPCHRVISSDLTVGGFSGHTSGPDIQRKIRMLKEEGVRFEGKKISRECLHRFTRSRG